MPLTSSDIRQMIDWLGEEGAKSGLDRSFLTVKELSAISASLGLELPAKPLRKNVVSSIISKLSQRIDKPVVELLAMSSEQLLQYFETVRPSKAELLSVLSELDFHPGSEAQKGLYKYAARQIAETGMFERVANKER